MGDSSLKALQSKMTKNFLPYSSSSSSSFIIYLNLKSSYRHRLLVIRHLVKKYRQKTVRNRHKKGETRRFPLNKQFNNLGFLSKKGFFSLSHKNSVTNNRKRGPHNWFIKLYILENIYLREV